MQANSNCAQRDLIYSFKRSISVELLLVHNLQCIISHGHAVLHGLLMIHLKFTLKFSSDGEEH